MHVRSNPLVSSVALALVCSLFASPAAADPMRIELSDGSVVTGELVAMDGDRLVVESPALGTVEIEQANVARMARLDADPTSDTRRPAVTGASNEMVSSVQSLMTSDMEVLGHLASLQDSALMQEILADQELMAKVRAGDLTALAQDPRIQRLAQDRRVQAIGERVNGE